MRGVWSCGAAPNAETRRCVDRGTDLGRERLRAFLLENCDRCWCRERMQQLEPFAVAETRVLGPGYLLGCAEGPHPEDGLPWRKPCDRSWSFSLSSPRPYPLQPRTPLRSGLTRSGPKPLPGNWILGQVAGLATDRNDRIWIVHRPKSLLDDEKGATQNPPADEVLHCRAAGDGVRRAAICCAPGAGPAKATTCRRTSTEFSWTRTAASGSAATARRTTTSRSSRPTASS